MGVEPTAIRLKVECSTTELQARLPPQKQTFYRPVNRHDARQKRAATKQEVTLLKKPLLSSALSRQPAGNGNERRSLSDDSRGLVSLTSCGLFRRTSHHQRRPRRAEHRIIGAAAGALRIILTKQNFS